MTPAIQMRQVVGMQMIFPERIFAIRPVAPLD